MPYISVEDRHTIGLGVSIIATPGQLNYGFTAIIVDYIEQHGLSYDTINAIMGALEGAKCEFYRRVAVPYEEQKLKENGDVY